ncbi:TonB-dependent receptor plug domain-containing protein [Maricaulis virginensis]|uniref:TonB-dependent receptor n=1 Tax=Maricaulis virginensis TaxID=144022 RepID=A0A9W6INX2_9PROT|nr:TonB-dependent receptor [Maricaulis virginensis]GLK52644.1 TonB-dependent receptor [Maricaulis virginensis]
MRIYKSLPLALAASSILISPAVLAQDAQDDDVILITAARVPIPADDATASITRLDAADIQARGSVFAADILRAVPGLAVSHSGAPGALTQIRARGAEANHVLVLIDGVEANNPFTGEADFAHFAFSDLGSIEVSRGEQSALWGADAIGGVVRLTTARPTTGMTTSLGLEGGEFGTFNGDGRIASTFERGWLTLSGSAYRSDGIDVSGTGGEEDGYENETVNLAGGYALNDIVRFEGSARWLSYDSAFDSDTDFDGLLNDVDRNTDGRTVFARAALLAEHSAGGFEIEHELAVQLTDDEVENYADGAPAGRSLGQRLQSHYEVTGRWSTGETQHRLTGLVEHDRDRLKSFTAPGAGSNQSPSIEASAFAADYGLDQGALTLTASVRRDIHDRFDDATTWRVGAGWAFEAVDGRARVSFGEGVKNPGIYELFGYFPGSFVGNPNLDPERSSGWEIGWDQTLLEGRATLSAVYFESELEDEIYTDYSTFPSTALNAASLSNRSGVELSGSWDISGSWSAFGSLSLLESEENGVAEIRRPEQLASLTLDWHPANLDWSGALTVDYTGDQLDTDFGSFQTVTLDAYTLVGGQVRWKATEALELYVRGENLLDEEYQDVFGYHTPGRGLYFGLRLRNG